MKNIGWLVVSSFCFTSVLSAETLPPLTNGVPQNVEELWAEIDLESEPLDKEILLAYEQDGVTLQVVRYRVGIFNGATAMVAGVYGYPTGQTNLPALVQIHGGGGFAQSQKPVANAKRGYATLSLAWAGRIAVSNYFVNNAIRDIYWAGDTNHPQYTVTTDWTGLSQDTGLTPKTNTYDDVESPRNSAWFLWAMAARRGLTFLEQQPEVDINRLGVYGHSMGGKLTVMTVGTDDRAKMAAPSCGGVSDRYDGALENATIGDSNYLAGISCPIFFLKPANDFHAGIDDVARAVNEIQSTDWRVHHSPHKNHQDYGEYEVATQIWMDQYLMSGMTLPDTPSLVWGVNVGGVPTVTVTIDTNRAVQAVEVYYTQMGEDTGEQHPWQDWIYRHWHYSPVQGTGDSWTADVPILSTNEPLWVYANVTYALDGPISSVGYYNQDFTTDEFVLSTPLEMLTSAQLRASSVVETLSVTNLIEDFQGDWEKEWFDYTRDSNDWAVTTHKVNDPVYGPPALSKLSLKVKSAVSNTLLLTMNGSATASVELPGGTEWQLIELLPMQFDEDGSPWAYDFDEANEFRLSSGSSPAWSGAAPQFSNLHWAAATQEEYDAFGVPGEYVQRNTAPDTWTDWSNVGGWYSESAEVRLPASNDWARIHFNRHTFLTNHAVTIAQLDMYWSGGADLRIDNGGSLTVSTAGGFDGSINLSGSGSFSGNPNTGDISIESGGSLVSGNTGTRTVLNGNSSQLGSLTLNGGTFTAQGSSTTNDLHLKHSIINLNSGTFDMTGGQTVPDGVVFNINGEGTDIDFGILNSSGAASDYSFTLGSNGVSRVDVSGSAHLSQARMVVDGTNYTGGAQELILFASTNLASTMNPANITVINFPEWATVTVEQDDVTTHDVMLHINWETPTVDTVIYSHDFEDGTQGGWAAFTEVHNPSNTPPAINAYDVDAALTETVENGYAVIYANQMAVLTLTNTFEVDHTYTFSLDHFARAGQAAFFGGEAIKLQFGYDADGSGTWTWLADQVFAATGANPANLSRREISYEATAGGAELGKRMMLRVLDADSSGHLTGEQAAIDNIVLTASSPTLGDISLGGLVDGDLVVSWNTTLGQNYSVLTNADLTTTNWGVSETMVGDGNLVWVTNTPAGPQLFYIVASP